MLTPIPGSEHLLSVLQTALGPERLPLLIGIDGRWGAGKTSLASWLGWQLSMPTISLDLYIVRDSDPLEWRYEDLIRVLDARTKIGRPVIVEGICLCQALQAIDREPDFFAWIENKSGPVPHGQEPTVGYVRNFQPDLNADFTLVWDGPEL